MVTDLTVCVDELLILTPYLEAALAADEGGPAEAERVMAYADPALRLPVDGATLLALAGLALEVPRAAHFAARVVAEPAMVRSIEGHLRQFPRWHERMLVTAARGEAKALADVAATLLSQVRLALGLRTPPRRLGQFCPMHDEPLRELVVPGDEATLRLVQGRIVGIEWTRHDEALCRTCGASWALDQLLTLRRLLREADERRVGQEVA